MIDWNLVSSGAVNWNAAQTISNAILVLVLIIITAYYARQTARQSKFMEMHLIYDMNQKGLNFDEIQMTMEFLENPKKCGLELRAKSWWKFWR